MRSSCCSSSTANVAIPRVDQGNIQGWQVPTANTVYLQDRGRKWYRADMSGACVRPDFNGRLGFRTGPGGRLETGSQIVSRSGAVHDPVADRHRRPAGEEVTVLSTAG